MQLRGGVIEQCISIDAVSEIVMVLIDRMTFLSEQLRNEIGKRGEQTDEQDVERVTACAHRFTCERMADHHISIDCEADRDPEKVGNAC